jgi:hypothetical protein
MVDDTLLIEALMRYYGRGWVLLKSNLGTYCVMDQATGLSSITEWLEDPREVILQAEQKLARGEVKLADMPGTEAVDCL